MVYKGTKQKTNESRNIFIDLKDEKHSDQVIFKQKYASGGECDISSEALSDMRTSHKRNIISL